MTREEIQKDLDRICGQIEIVRESISGLLRHLPDIQPHPREYKAALYLSLFTDSLEIGQKNVARLNQGKTRLAPRRY